MGSPLRKVPRLIWLIVVNAIPRCNAVLHGRIAADTLVLQGHKMMEAPAGQGASMFVFASAIRQSGMLPTEALTRSLLGVRLGWTLPARAPLSALAAEDIAHRTILMPAFLALPRHLDSPPSSVSLQYRTYSKVVRVSISVAGFPRICSPNLAAPRGAPCPTHVTTSPWTRVAVPREHCDFAGLH